MNLENQVVSVPLLGAFLLGAVLASSAANAESATSPRSARATASETAPGVSREILVTFVDERNERVPVGELTSVYRQRGHYSSSTWSQRYAAELAEEFGLIQKAQWPITALGVHCVVYEVPEPRSIEAVLRLLASDGRVESAQGMKNFHVMSSRADHRAGYSDPYFRMQPGLQSMRIESAHRFSTGRNVTVAVIDTGADGSHPDLVGRVASAKSFVPASPETATDIHGTAVSGIIAATADNGTGIVGIAPSAQLRVMKACWQSKARVPDAVCNTFTLALALNTAIGEKPQIINMSLNGPSDPLLRRLITKAMGAGIIVVASEAEQPSPENEFPASVDGVIAVRTAADPGFTSARGANAIAAPGREVLTTVPGAAYGFMTGSSFAAAHVSGLIALLLQVNPSLNREQVSSILRASARSADPGRASVDACSAVASLIPQSGGCSARGGLSVSGGIAAAGL
jgi:subtilisin family serine protease